MNIKSLRIQLSVAFTLLVLAAGTAFGQGFTTSSMNGRITDAKGEPLAGATVVAVHTPTGSKYGAVTGDNGYYRIPNMRVGGPYNVDVTFVGYETYSQENVYLSLGQSFRVSTGLAEEGVELAEVEITYYRNDVFDGNRTGAETVVTEREVNSLPTVARAIGDFVRMTPQATVREGGDGFSISLNGMNNRYNAIYIDGAVNNDVFGLAGSGTNGGQTGVSPVSLDAIEEFQIQLAPFDVRVGGFAGGAINVITRSGTNNLEGSVYHFFRNEGLAGKTPRDDGGERTPLPDFTAQTSGIRIGGPIIKDKLFFFVNGEIQRETTPQPFEIETYQGDASNGDLLGLRDKLINDFGYTPGTFTNNRSFLNSDKLNIKLDWNINDNHKVALRHGYVRSENLEGVRSNTRSIRFLNESEYFESTTNSTVLELNSVLGNNFSNNLTVGYTTVRDDRDPYQGDVRRAEDDNPNYFPYVIIQDGVGRITFGSEQFSTANALDQTVLTVTDNFEIYKGRHTFTIGTHNEFYSVYNLFIRQNYGVYEYDSLSQFMNNMDATEFYRSYSLVDDITGDGSAAAAEFSGAQFGIYGQDEFQVNENFKLTLGLRFDMPLYFSDTRENEDFNNETVAAIEAQGYDLRGARTGAFIDPQILISPRVGFNWDVTGDKQTQLRGGVGIFSSRIPLVWPGGAFNNNGITVGGDFNGSPDFGVHDFPRWDQQPQNVAPGLGQPSGQIDLFAENFKVPQVFKANLALDQKLPGNIIWNVDLMFNKTLNNVAYQNLNIKPATEFLTGGPDDRPIYNRRDLIDDTYTGIYMGYNTSRGYSYNLSTSFTKPFSDGFSAMVAYSYGDAFAVFDGTSSQNSSQWRGIFIVDGRNFSEVAAGQQPTAEQFEEGFNVVTRSDFSQGHRFIGGLTWEWPGGGTDRKRNKTTLSLFYEGVQGAPYSYIYDGNGLTNEDSRERSLIWIPADRSEINLVDAGGKTADQQWADLDAFIESDPYLSENRGSYAERNSNRAPWAHVIDARLLRDFTLIAGGKEHTFQLSLDVFNLTNLLNKNWGRRYFVPFDFQLIEFEGFEADGTTPTFSFPGVENNEPWTNNIDDSGVQSSRFQMQVGLRYIFN
jgi:hypothetical protein